MASLPAGAQSSQSQVRNASQPKIVPRSMASSGSNFNPRSVVPSTRSAIAAGTSYANKSTSQQNQPGALRNKYVHKAINASKQLGEAPRIPLVEKPRHFGVSQEDFQVQKRQKNGSELEYLISTGATNNNNYVLGNLNQPILQNYQHQRKVHSVMRSNAGWV